jgi:hypothetical protein
LTLAGAAEEMLGSHIKRMNCITEVSALDHEVQLQASFDALIDRFGPGRYPRRSVVEIRKELLKPRNSAKHFNKDLESTCNFDPRLESALMILRGLKNHAFVYPENADCFEAHHERLKIDVLDIQMRKFGENA